MICFFMAKFPFPQKLILTFLFYHILSAPSGQFILKAA
ncbi:hypothetical protein HMPREF1246_0937 [Acidaminococcus sp. BV3L6]|nr:hypothetical protein HMPREF1246_0937 [Acidaminococcus sp. BV3L6]